MMRRLVPWRCLAVLTGVALLAGGCRGGEVEVPTPEEPLVISGGGTTGVYYNYGRVLASATSTRLGVDAEVTETGGSVDNLFAIARQESVLAFTAADAAANAVAGGAPFDEPLPVRAVARVYDDFVHLVTPIRTGIRDIDDLRGRDVSLGAEGSGTEVIARRLLETAEIEVDELDNAMLGIDGSIEAMEDGEIDAFFWSGGLPTPGVDELADRLPIRLVPLGELVDDVSRAHAHVYRHGIVPRGTYGLNGDVPTMAVPNYLVTHADTDDDLVHALLELLFSQRIEMSREVSAIGLLDVRRAIYTDPVELHPGGLRYYREAKR